MLGGLETPAASAAAESAPGNMQEKAEVAPPDIDVPIPPIVPIPKCKQGAAIAFDMRDYARDTVNHYIKVTGIAKLRAAHTPFVPEGSVTHADECDPGEVNAQACSILMKALWLARLARPDILRPICQLASRIQSWSRAQDKKLFRLICYLNSTAHYRWVGRVCDPAHMLMLILCVDADLLVRVILPRARQGGYLCWLAPTLGFP